MQIIHTPMLGTLRLRTLAGLWLWCNCIDYSFFGSQTIGQTGVRVVGVLGHNTIQGKFKGGS